MAAEEQACPLTKGEQILVAIDGSVYSEYAVDQAISLGGMCNSKIYLVSVVDLYPDQMEVAPELVDKMSKENKSFLDRAKEKIDQASIPCETKIRTGGNPAQLILEEAQEKDIDLIVMGTHGRRGLKRALLGSVAQNVIGGAKCPVLVVPTLKS